MQATCCVDDDHIGLIGYGRLQRVEGHRCGVGTHFLLNDGHVGTMSPLHQLLYGSSAEGIGSAEIDLQSSLFELVCQLTNGCGLTYSIDTHHHDYIGAFGIIRDRESLHIGRFVLGEERCDLLFQYCVELVRRHILVTCHALLDALNDFQCSLDAHIRSDECLLQVVEHLIIHL